MSWFFKKAHEFPFRILVGLFSLLFFAVIVQFGAFGGEDEALVSKMKSFLNIPGHSPDADKFFEELKGTAIDPLVHIYQQNESLRKKVFEVLVHITPLYPRESAKAIPIFIDALKSKDSWSIEKAAECLETIGFESRIAIPDLANTLKAGKSRNSVLRALISIAESLQDNIQRVDSKELPKLASDLSNAFETAEDSVKDDSYKNYIKQFRWHKEYIILWQKYNDKSILYYLSKFIKRHSMVGTFLLVILLYLGLEIILILLYVFYPIGLISLNNFIMNLPRLNDTHPTGTDLAKILLTYFWSYRQRVLRAWTKKHVEIVKNSIENSASTSKQDIRIPLPVIVDDKDVPVLKAGSFHNYFKRNCTRILICGVGGVGKTNLAFELAKWSMEKDPQLRIYNQQMMLPVILPEESLCAVGLKKAGFDQYILQKISSKLRDFANLKKPIDINLLRYLLVNRHILVIVDNALETSPWLQELEHPEFPVNALILTSRSDNILINVQRTFIEPIQLQGEGILRFVESYIDKLGQRHRFEPGELDRACQNLMLIAGRGEITVLFAKMYADLILHRKEDAKVNMPRCVSDIVVMYLKFLNRSRKVNMPDDNTVYQDAKALSWACLQKSFIPSDLSRERVLEILEAQNKKPPAKERLSHLEKRLRLLLDDGISDSLRFSLEPLAEYLAGLWLTEHYNNNESKWEDLIQTAQKKREEMKEIEGFLSAVFDCCKNRRMEYAIPGFVIEQLGDLLNR